MADPETQQTVLGYLGRAWQMVDTGRLTLDLVLDETRTRELIDQAEKFVSRVERYLRGEGLVR